MLAPIFKQEDKSTGIISYSNLVTFVGTFLMQLLFYAWMWQSFLYVGCDCRVHQGPS